jgi:AAA family ATPase
MVVQLSSFVVLIEDDQLLILLSAKWSLAGVPSPGQRLDILHHLLTGVHHSLSSEEVESLAFATHGFVGADLAALCNEAALSALRRYISVKDSSSQLVGDRATNAEKSNIQEIDGPLGYEITSLSSSLSKLTMSTVDYSWNNRGDVTESSEPDDEKDESLLLVADEDFEKAKMKIRPSAMREVAFLSTISVHLVFRSQISSLLT